MRIAMTLQHSWHNDSRVIREAEALAAAAHDVRVFCRGSGPSQVVETRNGVSYHAIPFTEGLTLGHLCKLGFVHLRIHCMWLRDRFSISARCGFRHALKALGEFSLLVLAAVPAVVLAFGLKAIVKLHRVLPFKVAPQGPLARMRDGLYARRDDMRKLLARYAEPLFHLNDYAVTVVTEIARWKPDVVHVHDMISLSGGYLAARRVGVPYVYDAHELETHTNYQLSSLTWLFLARYERVLIRTAKHVITVCDSIADWLAIKYRIARPIVILNAPALDTAGPESAETVRAHLRLTNEEKLAVYIGSVTVDRGLERCVEALRYAPEVRLALVGWRYPVMEDQLRRLADHYGVADRLHFVDPVPSRLVVSFIRGADCSLIAVQNVCLSYYFCMPNKLLESVVGHLPVAVARLKELRAFLREFPVGVEMDETDPRSIAAAMIEITRDPAKYRPTDQQIAAIAARYGWQLQKERLIRLYGAWMSPAAAAGT